MATKVENLARGVATPKWRTYSGKAVVVHALEGSYAVRLAGAELRTADAAVEVLEKLLGPTKREGAVKTGGDARIDIYLSDPIVDPTEVQSGLTGADALVRIIEPESPGRPLPYLLAPLLISRGFGPEAASATAFVEGLAGVAWARCGGPKVEEAHNWVRNELSERRSVTIFGGSGESVSSDRERVTASFIEYMIDTYGAASLRTFLSEYDPQRRDQSAQAAFHRPLGTLEEQWLAHMRRTQAKGGRLGDFMRGVLPLVKPFWARQTEILLYMLYGLAYALAMPLASKYLVDNVIPSGSLNMLLVFITVLFFIYVLNLLVGIRRSYISSWVNSQILMRLQEKMFAHLQRLPHSYYARSKIGDIMTRLYSDLGVVQGAMLAVVNTGFYMILSAIGAGLALFIMSPLLASLVVLVVPLFAVSYFTLRERLQKASYERQRLAGEMSSSVQENLAAQPVIKSLGLEQRAEVTFHRRLMSVFKSGMRLVVLGALFESSTSLAVTLGELLVLGVGGYLTMQGEMTIGTLLAFFGFLPSLFSPVGAIASLGQTIQSASGSLERVNELLNEPVTIDEKPDAQVLPQLSHEIRLENVTFGYDSSRPILADLSLVIPAGTHVAVVGPSGSGKSTLVNLLMRYWDPDEGRITFDGYDLRDLTIDSLRGQIGLVFQDTFVFDTTLRENVGLGKLGATDQEIASAARAARLDSYVATLPAGFDTVLGERGVRMSGGQRQRLAIARALVRDPRILILDEATSALDAATEREILDTLTEVARGRTTISITHRLAFAAKADRIIVLEAGTIAEEGTHADLVNAGGLYSALWQEQTSGADRTVRIGIETARLRAIPLFSTLEANSLATLGEQVMKERYAGGEDVVRQGDPGDKLYLINKGQVEILVAEGSDGVDENGYRCVNTLNEGDYFGEMAVFTGEARTATVRTTQPSELYSLSQADFAQLLEREPEIRQAVQATIETRRVALAAVSSSAINGSSTRAVL